jgi:hypothetical protein
VAKRLRDIRQVIEAELAEARRWANANSIIADLKDDGEATMFRQQSGLDQKEDGHGSRNGDDAFYLKDSEDGDRPIRRRSRCRARSAFRLPATSQRRPASRSRRL